jgi:hypothetical protein
MRFGAVFAGAMRPAPQNSSDVASDRALRIVRSGLTMRQRAGGFCVDPEQASRQAGDPVIFINSKPRRRLPRRGESPLSGGTASYP